MNHLGRPYMIDSVAGHHLCDRNDPWSTPWFICLHFKFLRLPWPRWLRTCTATCASPVLDTPWCEEYALNWALQCLLRVVDSALSFMTVKYLFLLLLLLRCFCLISIALSSWDFNGVPAAVSSARLKRRLHKSAAVQLLCLTAALFLQPETRFEGLCDNLRSL